jgi:hypothetical protein
VKTSGKATTAAHHIQEYKKRLTPKAAMVLIRN